MNESSLLRRSRFLSLAFILLPLQIFAQSDPSSNSRLIIEGSSYSFDRNTGIVEYQRPRVFYQGQEMTGGILKYDAKKETITLERDIFFRGPRFIITGSRARYDMKTDYAVFESATVFDKQNQVYITASSVERTKENQFRARDGVVTSCDPAKPAWEIRGEYVVYNDDSYAWATHMSFHVHDVPVAYTPVIAWSTKRKRASGLLPPQYNFESDNGHRVKVPLFLEFSQEHDLTITADVIQQRGVGAEAEYNYAFEEGMAGQIDYWRLDETAADRNLDSENLGGKSKDEIDDKQPTRYKLSYLHKNRIFRGGQFFFEYRENSDNEVNHEYFGRAEGLDSRRRTAASFIFPWRGGGARISGLKDEKFIHQSVFDTATDEDTALNRLPEVAVNQAFNRIGGTPLSAALNENAVRFDRKQGWWGFRSISKADVRMSFNVDFLNLIPRYEAKYNYYDVEYKGKPGDAADADFDRKPDSFGYFIGHRQLELNLEVFRLFRDDQGFATGKLSFRPRIIYDKVDDVDQRKALNVTPGNIIGKPSFSDYDKGSKFDGNDLVFSRETVTFRWDTTFLRKNRATNNISKLVEFNLIQTFNLNLKDRDDIKGPSIAESSLEVERNKETPLGRPFGGHPHPLRIEFGLHPNSYFSGGVKYRYSYERSKIIDTEVTLTASNKPGGELSVSYRKNQDAFNDLENNSNPVSNFYSVNSLIKFGDAVDLTLAGSWDFNRDTQSDETDSVRRLDRKMTDASVGLVYRNCCYTLGAKYTEDIGTTTEDGRQREEIDRKFEIAITIQGNQAASAVQPGGSVGPF